MLRAFGLAVLAVLAAATAPGWSWWGNGHSIVTEAAVLALPAEIPGWFRQGRGTIAHCSQDPDVFKHRSTPQLRRAEEPEHYLDWELLKERPLPEQRYEFLKLCAELKQDPDKVGTLPYAIVEWTERLTTTFAEHRKWPGNPHVRAKALVYAGVLAHYTGDACMPLHTTVHFDGRARADGTSPRSGIHARVDSLIEKVPFTPAELSRELEVRAHEKLWPAVLAELKASHALVDQTYELEPLLPPREGAWKPDPRIRSWAQERGRSAARFTAEMYLSAWRNSARLTLPPYHERERFEFDRPRAQ